jgi:hypothetical protein
VHCGGGLCGYCGGCHGFRDFTRSGGGTGDFMEDWGLCCRNSRSARFFDGVVRDGVFIRIHFDHVHFEFKVSVVGAALFKVVSTTGRFYIDVRPMVTFNLNARVNIWYDIYIVCRLGSGSGHRGNVGFGWNEATIYWFWTEIGAASHHSILAG